MSMSIKSLTTTGRGYPQEVTMRLEIILILNPPLSLSLFLEGKKEGA
jgi:hypothetical protein